MVYIGLDIGSRNLKLVIINAQDKHILYSDVRETGIDPKATINTMLRHATHTLKIAETDIAALYSTGYGRKLASSDKTVSEISCHAKGVQYALPEARTIIDIGGQDSKIISIGENKLIRDFVMNDKCAAGTGRFLEMVAIRLGITCPELSALAAQSSKSINLSSTCVVFAESEIIGLTAEGDKPSDIARAVHLSIAGRIIAQINQLHWETPVVFTGGVAFNHDLHQIIAGMLGCEVIIPPNPELTGALGAALIAAEGNE